MDIVILVVVALAIVAAGLFVSVRGKRAVQRTGADLDRLMEQQKRPTDPDS